MYYDDDCNGDGNSGAQKGWFITAARPDDKATSDLDGDGACNNYMYKSSVKLADSMMEGGSEGEWTASADEIASSSAGAACSASPMSFKFNPICEDATDAQYKWSEWEVPADIIGSCGGVARTRGEIEIGCTVNDPSGCACNLVGQRQLEQQEVLQAACRNDIDPIICQEEGGQSGLVVNSKCYATANVLNELDGVKGVDCVENNGTSFLHLDEAHGALFWY
jgi:hypothetical protein